jgi:hypothetical protein
MEIPEQFLDALADKIATGGCRSYGLIAAFSSISAISIR